MVNVQAQFDKAVAIVKALPPDGPVKPTQDDQLAVSQGVRSALDIHGLEASRKLLPGSGSAVLTPSF